MNILTGRAGGALTNKFGVNMSDTCGVEMVVSDLTEEVGVASDTVGTTFGAIAVVSGELSCGEIFTGTAAATYGAEISTGAVVTGGSCAAW